MQLDAKAVQLHTRMLNDRGRTQGFIEAIEQVVRPGDVVLDIGTGTGILALAAARAGARRVYAIESRPVRKLARKLFEANGLGDRITLVAGHSTEVELPERADVLVTEVFGNSPLGERVLETTADARSRLLKRHARIVPSALRVFGLPVSVPEGQRGAYVFTPGNFEKWRSWYGFDFAPLGAANRQTLLTLYLEPRAAAGWTALAPHVLLAEIEPGARGWEELRGTSRVAALGAGELNALVIYFELQLSPSVSLSTDPRRAAPDNHWLNPVYFFVDPLRLKRGDALELTYWYEAGDKDEWVSVSLLG